MTDAIQTLLDTTGVCYLGPGKFYVTGVEVANYAMLCGSGNATVLMLSQDVEDGFAVKLKTYACVKDLYIKGSQMDYSPISTVGTRHGIIFEGSADTESKTTYYRSCIENCHITDFSGGGITCNNTGLSIAASLCVSDCQIARCGAGVNISYFSEYHRWTNVVSQSCYYGCICNGGNNNFSNCDFSGNEIGLLIDNSEGQSRNNSHGTFAACSFNHSGGNDGTAIRLLGANSGEVFIGAQIFFGAIEIENCVGIRFVGANMGRKVPIKVTDSELVVFSDCTMYDAEASTLTLSGNQALKFENCYNRDGSVFGDKPKQ